MAKTIATYKGLWRHSKPEASPGDPLPTDLGQQRPSRVVPASYEMAKPEVHAGDPLPTGHGQQRPSQVVPASYETMHLRSASMDEPVKASDTGQGSPKIASESSSIPPLSNPTRDDAPALLGHRYRLLVLREHRHKLGRDLLEAGHQNPWRLAWGSITSLGHNFRPWAHARIFALGCYLGVDMSPEVLRQLRHPLWFKRYRRSMFGLWRLLEILAQKTGQKPLSRFMFRLFYLCPPLAILIYEKELQTVLRQAQGTSPSAAGTLASVAQSQ